MQVVSVWEDSMFCAFLFFSSEPTGSLTDSLRGLVVITVISRAIIAAHSLQGICEPIWFVHLLMRLHQHHLIWLHSGRPRNDQIQYVLVIFHTLCMQCENLTELHFRDTTWKEIGSTFAFFSLQQQVPFHSCPIICNCMSAATDHVAARAAAVFPFLFPC